jgi:hypothetical protein
MVDARGNFYAPSPAPQGGSDQATRQWADRDFGRIASAIRAGRSQYLSLDVLEAVPERTFPGMVAYFAANVVGTAEGLYEFRSSPAGWNKL